MHRNLETYRKEIGRTQQLWRDHLLDETIKSDMEYINNLKGGQFGMYADFPFSFTRKSTVSKTIGNGVAITTELMRSYALGSVGGIAVIEEIIDGTAVHRQIVTLGEDDGCHFISCARLFEVCYGSDKEFITLVKMAIDEYEKNRL